MQEVVGVKLEHPEGVNFLGLKCGQCNLNSTLSDTMKHIIVKKVDSSS